MIDYLKSAELVQEDDQSTLTASGVTESAFYVCEKGWSSKRPHVLVIACADGRLQISLDDFLNHHLGIVNYDRMYLPGGPGALASSGKEFSRADAMRHECTFLIEAHQLEDIILIFHGAAAEGDEHDGPTEACCADYARKLPHQSTARLNQQHCEDYRDIMERLFHFWPTLRVRAYRAEVIHDHRIRFLELTL